MGREDHDPERLSTEEVGRALEEMEAADWKRAERYARIAAHGLQGMDGEDLLNQACTLLLAGNRRFPRGKKPVRVLRNAVRSIASNARVAGWGAHTDGDVLVEPEHDNEDADLSDDAPRRLAPAARNAITPEVEALAREEFEAVMALLKGDGADNEVLEAWACGMRGAEVMEITGLSATDYDAARKRLGRKIDSLTSEGRKS